MKRKSMIQAARNYALRIVGMKIARDERAEVEKRYLAGARAQRRRDRRDPEKMQGWIRAILRRRDIYLTLAMRIAGEKLVGKSGKGE